MTTYTTVQGDMFDLIAKKTLGDEKFAPQIMTENPDFLGVQVFDGGRTLIIPDVDETTRTNLPPWKEAVG